jgi:hypothetical protein
MLDLTDYTDKTIDEITDDTISAVLEVLHG